MWPGKGKAGGKAAAAGKKAAKRKETKPVAVAGWGKADARPAAAGPRAKAVVARQVTGTWEKSEPKEGEKSAWSNRPAKLEREAGTEERQAGTQVPTRELLWLGAGRERGTQVYAHAAPEPAPRVLPPLDEQWKALKILGHLLAALKSQQEGRSSRPQQKGMADTMEVLGSVGELLLPASAYEALTSPGQPPPLPKEPGKRFLEALHRLPAKPFKREVQEALRTRRLVALPKLGAFLSAYVTSMELTDRAVRNLLSILVREGVLHPLDLEDYHGLITLHLKDRKANRPITIAKGLAEFHTEVGPGWGLRLKRRTMMPAVLPPQPRSLNLRLLGSLLCQVADVAEAGTSAGRPGADLSAAAARDLAESQLSIQRSRPLSSALVSLALVARYLARSPDLPVQLRQVGSGVTRRLSGGNFGPWPLEDLGSAFFLLSARLRLPWTQWGELVWKLAELGWLNEEKAALLLKVLDGEAVGAMEALGWLLDLVEGDGEWWELSRRTELAPHSVVGEPVRWGRLAELAEGDTGAALGLLVEFVAALKVEKGQRGRDGREVGLEERAARVLALQRLRPLLTTLEATDVDNAAKASALVAQGGETSTKLAALFELFFPRLRLTRAQLLPVLLRLKAQRRINILQFSALLSKTPYPVPFPVLRAILDKVLAWNTAPATKA